MEKDRGKYNEPTEINSVKPENAFAFLQFGAIRLSYQDRVNLLITITMYSGTEKDFLEMNSLLSNKLGFSDDHAAKVLGCIRNPECRTKLIRIMGGSLLFKLSADNE